MCQGDQTLSSKPLPSALHFQHPCLLYAPQVKLSRLLLIARRVSNDWTFTLSQPVFASIQVVLVQIFAVCGCCLELDLPCSRNQLAFQPNRAHMLISLVLSGLGAPWFSLVVRALIANAVWCDQVRLSFTGVMDGYWSFRMHVGSLREEDCFARSRLQSAPPSPQQVMLVWLRRPGP